MKCETREAHLSTSVFACIPNLGLQYLKCSYVVDRPVIELLEEGHELLICNILEGINVKKTMI